MVPDWNSNTSPEHWNTWNIGTWYQTGTLVPAHLRVVSRNNTADVLCGGVGHPHVLSVEDWVHDVVQRLKELLLDVCIHSSIPGWIEKE